jgi:hypothetical protein
MRTSSKASLATFGITLALCIGTPRDASADDTERSTSWQTVTSITMAAGVATTTLMPRIFYADPETTAGWKARWHISVLAPTLANLSLTMLNEHALKDAIRSHRPGCSDENFGSGHCQDFGSLSSHAFLSFSAFGQGTAVFLVDTFKWSDGRFNVGAFVGDVAFPLVFAGITAVGRSAGNWEDGGTVVLSSVSGLVIGGLTGLTYGLLQRPECGYTGSLICW